MKGKKPLFLVFAAVLLSLGFIEAWLGVLRYPPLKSELVSFPANRILLAKLVDHTFTIWINSKGIRYKEIPDQKESADEIRVVVLGASFAFGEGVEQDEIWHARLERAFSKQMPVRFINCGISGAGVVVYEKILYQIGLRYHPDKILVLMAPNEINNVPLLRPTGRVAEEKSGRNLRVFLSESFPRISALTEAALAKLKPVFCPPKRMDIVSQVREDARARGIPERRVNRWASQLPPKDVQLVNEGWLEFRTITQPLFDPLLWTRNLDLAGEESRQKWEVIERTLETVIKVCRSRGIDTAFVYAPHPYQYDASFNPLPEKLGLVVKKEWLTEESKLESRFRRFFEEQKSPFLDLTPAFQEAARNGKGPLNFGLDAHWNAEGHRFAAGRMEKWLKEVWKL